MHVLLVVLVLVLIVLIVLASIVVILLLLLLLRLLLLLLLVYFHDHCRTSIRGPKVRNDEAVKRLEMLKQARPRAISAPPPATVSTPKERIRRSGTAATLPSLPSSASLGRSLSKTASPPLPSPAPAKAAPAVPSRRCSGKQDLAAGAQKLKATAAKSKAKKSRKKAAASKSKVKKSHKKASKHATKALRKSKTKKLGGCQKSQKPQPEKESKKPVPQQESKKPVPEESKKPVLEESKKPVPEESKKPVPAKDSKKSVPEESKKPVLQNESEEEAPTPSQSAPSECSVPVRSRPTRSPSSSSLPNGLPPLRRRGKKGGMQEKQEPEESAEADPKQPGLAKVQAPPTPEQLRQSVLDNLQRLGTTELEAITRVMKGDMVQVKPAPAALAKAPEEPKASGQVAKAIEEETAVTAGVEQALKKKEEEKKVAHARYMRFSRSLQSQRLSEADGG